MLIHYFILYGGKFFIVFSREVHVPRAACEGLAQICYFFSIVLKKTSWVILLINNIYSLSMSATKMATCREIYITQSKSFWKTFQSCEWKYYFNIFITQSKNLNTLLGNWIFFLQCWLLNWLETSKFFYFNYVIKKIKLESMVHFIFL